MSELVKLRGGTPTSDVPPTARARPAGRTGRVLNHAVRKRRNLAPVVVPPMSLVLATWPDDYVAGLTAISPAASDPPLLASSG